MHKKEVLLTVYIQSDKRITILGIDNFENYGSIVTPTSWLCTILGHLTRQVSQYGTTRQEDMESRLPLVLKRLSGSRAISTMLWDCQSAVCIGY